MQQNVVGHRLHDARHARHIELERADAELLGVAWNFLDLLLGEDLRVEDGVDVAALVHRLAERGQVVEIGILQAAQENSDGGHAAENGGPGLGFGFAFVGLFVADMGVRIEDAGQHRPPGGVVGLVGRLREVLAQRDNLAAGNSHVGLDLSDAGNDQSAAAHQQVEPLRAICGPCWLCSLIHLQAAVVIGLDIVLRAGQQFPCQRRPRDLAAVLEHVAAHRLLAERLVHGRRVDNDEIGAAAGGDAVVRHAGGLRAVDRDHVGDLLELVRQGQLRHMRHHRGAFERVGLAERIVGIVDVVLRGDDVGAARQQFLDARDAAALRLAVDPRRADQIDMGVHRDGDAGGCHHVDDLGGIDVVVAGHRAAMAGRDPPW